MTSSFFILFEASFLVLARPGLVVVADFRAVAAVVEIERSLADVILLGVSVVEALLPEVKGFSRFKTEAFSLIC